MMALHDVCIRLEDGAVLHVRPGGFYEANPAYLSGDNDGEKTAVHFSLDIEAEYGMTAEELAALSLEKGGNGLDMVGADVQTQALLASMDAEVIAKFLPAEKVTALADQLAARARVQPIKDGGVAKVGG